MWRYFFFPLPEYAVILFLNAFVFDYKHKYQYIPQVNQHFPLCLRLSQDSSTFIILASCLGLGFCFVWLFFFFFFQYNHVTMLYQFLLYSEVNQLEGNGNPLQYSCLENPMDAGAWWAAVYGVAQSRTRLKRLSSSSSSSRESRLSQKLPSRLNFLSHQSQLRYTTICPSLASF